MENRKLAEIDALKAPTLIQCDDDFKLRYTYDSNAIEGNTLTLLETKVVLEGITVGGKTLKEHLETINHAHAFDFVLEIANDADAPLSEHVIKSIHALILKGVDDENAGKYRTSNVKIAGARHKPPPFYDVPHLMQNFATWAKTDALNLHAVTRAARVHVDFVGIHPFADGNGRTARLLMNLELLKAGFPAVNIPKDKRLLYYESLDSAHCDNNFSTFENLITDALLERLKELKGF